MEWSAPQRFRLCDYKQLQTENHKLTVKHAERSSASDSLVIQKEPE